MTTKINVLNLN